MQYAKDFLKFVDASPSPFHAVQQSIQFLSAAGFSELKESDNWDLKPSGKYYFTRNKSAIIAFTIGGKYTQANGFSIVGAHTDSPCLKVKPISKREKLGYLQVGVELYGGGLWHTWFDRDLALAGRVLVRNSSKIDHRLVKIDKPILRIPTLAIHLTDRSEKGFVFNNEIQLTPILALAAEKELNKPANNNAPAEKHHSGLLKLLAAELKCDSNDILDFELCLYDTQPASISGLNDEFLNSARLDNLMMSFCSLNALVESVPTVPNDKMIRVISLFDNEEVGSVTSHGAASNMLESTLRRLSNIPIGDEKELHNSDWIVLTFEQDAPFERAMPNSLLISADMAHALHPNYVEKHEENHRPLMNKGVVIKQNANQRYATTAITTLVLREAAKIAGVQLQEFVVRNDSPCGSTIGPMLSAKLGLRTIDVGNPQLSMHSIRETCGTQDIGSAIKLFKAFFESFGDIDMTICKG